MDVLVVGGAWALGSVAVSLLVGAVVSRAERPLELPATPSGPSTPARSASPRALAALPLALPAPRTSPERAVTTS